MHYLGQGIVRVGNDFLDTLPRSLYFIFPLLTLSNEEFRAVDDFTFFMFPFCFNGEKLCLGIPACGRGFEIT